ncbi:MAG TPA: hypothetical protein VFI34_06620 [Candidatus Limnocylindrales bacterium]|nr:hypothetical protein [Candidatus Limnocylindrales bacterium]
MVGPDEPNPPHRASVAPIALGAALALAVAAVVVAIVAGQLVSPRPSAGPSVLGRASDAPSAVSSAGSSVGPLGSVAPAVLTGSAPRVGAIAAVDAAGALSVIASDGHAVALTAAGEQTLGFPAWSPDGAKLAAIIGRSGVTSVDAFTIDPAGAAPGPPSELYRSRLQQAFYVAWTPGARNVSFLANDADVVALRVIPADSAAPTDETDPTTLVRRGAPLYFDWLDDDRALLHVGVGDGAFLGRVGRDGSTIGEPFVRPGAFRSAQASADGQWLSWIRTLPGSEDEQIVVGRAQGGTETTLPVFGTAAVAFAPQGSLVAAIGADTAGQSDPGFPLGPLRVIDPERGESRVLLDGAVITWFWSPDARTIFALRLQVPNGTSADASMPRTAAGSPSPVPSEVHALFVDVASGSVRADHVVRPGQRLVSEILPYFDQYALSHRLWAPDSSSILLPILGPDGNDTVVDLPADGSSSPFSIAASAAFWTP